MSEGEVGIGVGVVLYYNGIQRINSTAELAELMNGVPSIDLHPEKIRGNGPEAALLACRSFLDRALAAGHRQVRIITGLGLRGDGTPRLRQRVEDEVLSAYFSRIEQRSYEQGGAVIRVWLKAQAQAPSAAWKRQERKAAEQQAVAGREERLLVAYDRLEAAETALEEGDLRRLRLKVNQVAKEFDWEQASAEASEDKLVDLLDQHWQALHKLDQRG
jgi:DNA-nicking Smr family endonuclease